jgi:hypothetical protein
MMWLVIAIGTSGFQVCNSWLNHMACIYAPAIPCRHPLQLSCRSWSQSVRVAVRVAV